jgi:hypothetical protein
MQVTKIDPADVIRRSPAACAKLQAERQAARAARKEESRAKYKRQYARRAP